jgi:putative heme-binding domain-containing protein
VTPQAGPELAAGLIDALAASTAPEVGQLVVAKLKTLPAAARPAAVRLVLARPATTKALLDAVEAGGLRFDLLALDQKTALAAHPDAVIGSRAKKLLAQGGGLPDANRQKVIDGLHHVLAKTGDVAAGKAAFVKHCAKCHKHGGEGQVIGPDLTGFAVHPKEEILIHVMDPSRSVEGNYRAYTAKLSDGRVVTGLLASETKTTVELLDAENKRHPLRRDDLDELVESPKSLMPEGFEQQMTAAEITDVLEFMTQKGKYLPLPIDKVATATSTRGMFGPPDDQVSRLELADWSPKTVGEVPFALTDPRGQSAKNVILLHGPLGTLPPSMPKTVSLPCGTAAAKVHILGGVAGWAYPYGPKGGTSLTVRLHYADGRTEDHPLVNGVHIADYIRRADVPGSAFAFRCQGGQQVRALSVAPKRDAVISRIEFVKGTDDTAPIVMAVTVEGK